MSSCNIIPQIKTNKEAVDSLLFTELYKTMPRAKALEVYDKTYSTAFLTTFGNWIKVREGWIEGKYKTVEEGAIANNIDPNKLDKYGEPIISEVSPTAYNKSENIPYNNAVVRVLDKYEGKIETVLYENEANRLVREINTLYNNEGVYAKALPQSNDGLTYKIKLYTKDGRPYSYNVEGRLTPEIQKIISKLSMAMPGTRVKYLTYNQARFQFKIPNNVNSFVQGDTVYIITDRVTEETAIEEMLHPFVYAIYKNNNEYFKKLLAESKELYPSLEKSINKLYSGTPDTIPFEIVTQALAKAYNKEYESNNVKTVSRVKEFIKEFWNTLSQFFSDLFGVYGGKLSAYNIPSNMTLGQLAKIINTEGIGLETEYTSTPFYNLTQTSAFVNQTAGNVEYTVAQKETAEKLMALSDVVFNEKENNYKDTGGNIFKRVSQYLDDLFYNDNKGYFRYDGAEDDYKESQDWGNQADKILEGILVGKSKATIVNEWNQQAAIAKGTLSEDMVETLYDQLVLLTEEELKDVLLVPQVTVYNKQKGIAGRADIVAVFPDGSITVLDLKTGKTSTKSYDYTKTYKNSEGKYKSSKKERQQAQLSAYKALFQSQGFVFNEDNPLSIIPIHLKEISDDLTVTDFEIEDPIELNAMQPILSDLNQDSQYKGETFIDNPEIVKQAETVIEKIKKSLENRLMILENTGSHVKGVNFRRKQIESLKQQLNNAENLKSIENFIEDAYRLFIATKVGDKTIPGLVGTIRTQLKEIDKSDNVLESLNDILYYKNLVETYIPILDELSNFYYKFYDLDVSSIGENHPINKLRAIRDANNNIKTLYSKEILPKIAKILAGQTSSSLNSASKEQYDKAMKLLAKKKADGKKTKALESFITVLENRNVTARGVDEEVILKMLEEGSFEDISSIDRLLSPAISSSNSVIALFAKKLKEVFENARLRSMEFSRHAVKAFQDFKGGRSSDNPAEFNKDFYKLVSTFQGDKEYKRYQFVSPIDMQKFNSAKNDFYKSIEGMPHADKLKRIEEWNKANYEGIPENDLTITNPETKEVTIIQKGRNTLIKEAKKLVEDKIWTKIDYEIWIDSVIKEEPNGSISYKKEFRQPKLSLYADPKYTEIQRDPSKKKYYDFLVSSHFDSQKVLPPGNQLGYVLPAISKNNNDRLRDTGVWNYVKYKAKNAVSILPEDEDKYNRSENSLKIVPVLYHNYLDPSDVSLDLISSVMIYRDAALKYKAQSSMQGMAETTLDALKENTPYKTNTLGAKILDQAAEKAGVKSIFEKYKKKHNGNNVAALFESFVDMQIFNKMNIPTPINTFFGEISVDKMANTVMGITSSTQIGGFNVIGSAANSLMNRVSVSIEAAAKNYVTEKNWLKAELIYGRHSGEMISDFASPINKSFIGQLVDLYDIMQGEYKDKYGRKVSQSVWKKLWSTDTWFFFSHQTDYSIQVQLMIAQMLETKVKQTQPDGSVKEIPMYQAYEKDSAGKIKLKEGVVLNGKADSSGLVDFDFQNRLHALNKRMFGVYNSFDKPSLERFWYGKLLLMYKKHVVPGFKRRYKGISRDEELGDITEGYYNTIFRLLGTEAKELGKSILGKDSTLTSMEKQNAKKALRDILWVITSGTFIILLQAMMEGADDDEKAALRYPLFLSMRLNADLGLYGTPGDPQNFALPNLQETLRLAKNPSPIFGTLDKTLKLVNQLFQPFETYDHDSGIWSKGDNKAIADLLKLWGVTGANFNPENSIKFMQTMK